MAVGSAEKQARLARQGKGNSYIDRKSQKDAKMRERKAKRWARITR